MSKPSQQSSAGQVSGAEKRSRRETNAAKAERFRLEGIRLGREDVRLRAEEQRLADMRRNLEIDGMFSMTTGKAATGMLAFVETSLYVLASNALDGVSSFDGLESDQQATYLYQLSILLSRARNVLVGEVTRPKAEAAQ